MAKKNKKEIFEVYNVPNKAMVFPVVMYGCESWTIKKAERRRIDAFELWCWRRLLRADSLEKTLMLGKIENRRRRG